MQLPKVLRRYLAAMTALLFLACQGMAAVYARPAGAAVPDTAAAREPCHDISQQITSDKFTSTCRANCDTQHISSTPPGAFVYAAADLPAITALNRIVVVVDAPLPADPPLLRIEPPPHTILHCCLRN